MRMICLRSAALFVAATPKLLLTSSFRTIIGTTSVATTSQQSHLFYYHVYPPMATRRISGTAAQRRRNKKHSKTISLSQKNFLVNKVLAKYGITTVQDVTNSYSASAENDKSMDQTPKRTTTTKPKKQEKDETAYSIKYKGKKKNETPLVRVDRILANRGIGSRAEMQALCKARRIALVQNLPSCLLNTAPFVHTPPTLSISSEEENDTPISYQIVKGPSERIPENAILLLDRTHVIPPLPLLLLYHKPKGVLSTMKDERMIGESSSITTDGGTARRKHLGDVLSPQYLKALHPVGRLDYDTSGLLFFSSNGELTQRLLHPKHEIDKEYVATVSKSIESNDETQNIRQQFQAGVTTAEGVHTADIVSITSIIGTNSSSIRLIVSEGKHRMVRRMLANIGYPVIELKRERHGPCLLNDLPEGHFRHLSQEELHSVQQLLYPNTT
mmetsp:Transcript_3711/g.5551  ORF Transcript_3711/g.5551 Transcript_3711/m.5551 type:complete len:443 (+) Transcript_3711:37-1365(+)